MYTWFASIVVPWDAVRELLARSVWTVTARNMDCAISRMGVRKSREHSRNPLDGRTSSNAMELPSPWHIEFESKVR
jgi:hypothetical protein